ncbi:MAG: hypothetical protein U0270_21630 [Labilithrix sp.]
MKPKGGTSSGEHTSGSPPSTSGPGTEPEDDEEDDDEDDEEDDDDEDVLPELDDVVFPELDDVVFPELDGAFPELDAAPDDDVAGAPELDLWLAPASGASGTVASSPHAAMIPTALNVSAIGRKRAGLTERPRPRHLRRRHRWRPRRCLRP